MVPEGRGRLGEMRVGFKRDQGPKGVCVCELEIDYFGDNQTPL